MLGVSTEQIFQAFFNIASKVQGSDWSGSPIPLNYATRNWEPPNAVGVMPKLPAYYQLDPREEVDQTTGIGRVKRKMMSRPRLIRARQLAGSYRTIISRWARC